MKLPESRNTLAVKGVSLVVRGLKRERAMRNVLAGLVLSAAMAAGAATVTTTPAKAAGIYVNVGNGYHHHRRHHWRHHRRGYYWHNRYWQHRYWCDRHHRRWCYR